MDLFSAILIILGLCLFETICSIDNAIINAEVLSTMGQKARRWFLFWGLLFAVFIVRGFLPWLLVWSAAPELGFMGSLTATFSNDPRVIEAVNRASPLLLVGGGVFLVSLFLHWIFVEDKNYGLIGEKFIHKHGLWFYAIMSVFLTFMIWQCLNIDPFMALGASIGSSAFFITHGFKKNAEENEKKLIKSHLSDWSKILYLEVIDATFSIDGVIGAFAFTLSVPLILFGNGLGALVLRQLTVSNIDRIKKYAYLKNGAMYSILVLGIVMILDSFGAHIPHWFSPLATFGVIGYFFYKSVNCNRKATGL